MSRWLELWYEALQSSLGIKLRTNNQASAMASLYAARTKANDPALGALGLVRSPTSQDEVWIVKRNPDA